MRRGERREERRREERGERREEQIAYQNQHAEVQNCRHHCS